MVFRWDNGRNVAKDISAVWSIDGTARLPYKVNADLALAYSAEASILTPDQQTYVDKFKGMSKKQQVSLMNGKRPMMPIKGLKVST